VLLETEQCGSVAETDFYIEGAEKLELKRKLINDPK